tara:strand:- start:1160 stop:1417 length:258 start_codon:yes stop_codon:yes gene_type:complete
MERRDGVGMTGGVCQRQQNLGVMQAHRSLQKGWHRVDPLHKKSSRHDHHSRGGKCQRAVRRRSWKVVHQQQQQKSKCCQMTRGEA